MFNQRLFLATCLGMCGTFSTLLAEEKVVQQPDRSQLFKQIDANGDGLISPDEAPDDRRRLFDRLLRRGDANSDGKLSLDELTKAMADEERTAPPADAAGDGFRRFLEADPQETFKRLDSNGDGKVELSELPEQVRERLQQFLVEFDSNGDKALSLEEFRKGQQMLRTRLGLVPPQPMTQGGLLRVLDTNGDGALSKEEIAAASDSLRKLDADGDGAISNRELMRVLAGQPGRPTASPNGNTRPEATAFLERLRALDKDGDGKWSLDELPPFLQPQFDKIDTNSDKLIDGDELRAALQKLRRPQ